MRIILDDQSLGLLRFLVEREAYLQPGESDTTIVECHAKVIVKGDLLKRLEKLGVIEPLSIRINPSNKKTCIEPSGWYRVTHRDTLCDVSIK
jgi:hypothetical protein